MKALVYGVNPVGWVTCKWLKRLWPGCLFTRLNGVRLRDIPPPELPGDEWVRCRTILGGICGSDLGIVLQRQPANSFLQSFSALPAVMGHENVAVVDRIGPGVDPLWLGRRVCADPGLSCRVRGITPPCRACAEGHYGACENFSAGADGECVLPPGSCLGYCAPVGGSWGEYFVAHACQLVEAPVGLSDAQAVLTDPLACSLHAVLRAGLDQADRVLVYGAGILGLGVVWAARATGYAGALDVVARHPHQGDLARRFGATEVLRLPAGRRERFERIGQRTGGRVTRARFGNYMLSGGYDVVFECVGRKVTIEEACKWTRSRGRMVMVGMGHGRGSDMTAIWFGELTVIGCSGRSLEDYSGRKVHTYHLVHELMQAKGPDVGELLTHTFDLGDYKAALTTAMDKGARACVKVAFRFPEAALAAPGKTGDTMGFQRPQAGKDG